MQQHCPYPDWFDDVVIGVLVEVEDGRSDRWFVWRTSAQKECVRPITDEGHNSSTLSGH